MRPTSTVMLPEKLAGRGEIEPAVAVEIAGDDRERLAADGERARQFQIALVIAQDHRPSLERTLAVARSACIAVGESPSRQSVRAIADVEGLAEGTVRLIGEDGHLVVCLIGGQVERPSPLEIPPPAPERTPGTPDKAEGGRSRKIAVGVAREVAVVRQDGYLTGSVADRQIGQAVAGEIPRRPKNFRR